MLAFENWIATVKELDCVESDCKTAVMVTLPPAGGRFGAVYTPAADMVPTVEFPPVIPFTCHETAGEVLLLVRTATLYAVDDPAGTVVGPEARMLLAEAVDVDED